MWDDCATYRLPHTYCRTPWECLHFPCQHPNLQGIWVNDATSHQFFTSHHNTYSLPASTRLSSSTEICGTLERGPPISGNDISWEHRNSARYLQQCILLPSRSLTVRPWKVTFPIGKWSSNHHFSGAILNFRGVCFQHSWHCFTKIIWHSIRCPSQKKWQTKSQKQPI